MPPLDGDSFEQVHLHELVDAVGNDVAMKLAWSPPEELVCLLTSNVVLDLLLGVRPKGVRPMLVLELEEALRIGDVAGLNPQVV